MIQIKKSKYDNYCTCCRRPFDDSMEISFSHKDYNDSVNITLCGNCRRELMEALSKVETNCPEIPDSWIPVSERLPEKTGIYIVTGKTFISSNNFPNDFYRSTQVHKYSEKTGWDTFFSDEIFAWMPLPEPWKGEQ